MAAAAEDSVGVKRNPAGAGAALGIIPALRFFRKLSEGGLEEVTQKRVREDESEQRGDDGDGAGAAVEEEGAVEAKRARVEEAPEAPARKEDRETGKLYRVKVHKSDRAELRVWRGTKGNSWGCEHGRERSKCKKCGGACICEHGRVRSKCKECGGASICEHGRVRSKCKECGGASICEHGRERSKCKECGGASICEHGRQRSQCKECGGNQI